MQTPTSGWLPRCTSRSAGAESSQHQHCSSAAFSLRAAGVEESTTPVFTSQPLADARSTGEIGPPVHLAEPDDWDLTIVATRASQGFVREISA